MTERNSKEQLSMDLFTIVKKALDKDYMLSAKDIFALGYMSAKYGLEKFIDNQESVIKACQEYDKTDDLALLDTIGETLIDLGVINNDKGIL